MPAARSNRTASPTPSDNSDVYWDHFDNDNGISPSPAPSETADPHGWDSDLSPVPFDSAEATPTQACPSSPASVMEIEDPSPAKAAKPKNRAPKGKGRKKAKAVTRDEDDPFLVADIQLAKQASMGLTTAQDYATEGASSSRRSAAAPGSPSKRLRSNTAGDAVPASPIVATTSDVTTTAAPIDTAPDAATPAATVITTSVITTFAAVVAAAPTTAPAPTTIPGTTTTSDVAMPTTAQAATAPAAAPAVAPFATALAATPPTANPVIAAPAAAPAIVTPAAAPAPTTPAAVPVAAGPVALLQGIPIDLQQIYDAVPHPKFFLVVSGGNGAVLRTHGLIRDAIGNFINIDPAGFTLGTPPTAANGTSPSLWLAADIPNHLAQSIVDNKIISSTDITIYPIPYNMPVMGFVGVFAGFTLPNTAAGANAARDLLRTAIAANSDIGTFVQTHRDAFGPQVSAGEAWTIFLASITVHGIVLLVNDTNTITWRLHLNIMTALYGTARLQRAFCCRICPSIDHPTPLCPLPGLPGWLGPTPATIAALEDASRAAAAKAQDQMRLNAFEGVGGSGPNSGNGRGRGATNKKPRGDGKKRGNDPKGKGKRRDLF
ncbi:hypothetical protein DFH07DRAFT_785495 [Mycena maculata]|uniref:Uncharacterized protein n=1 Tax=Mycena maculata TaxID=230809 RepID=A0AAD7HA18_9AGAR|nr:hypothetical protein DFH07DRAFT_785495 [Mycena maculata]